MADAPLKTTTMHLTVVTPEATVLDLPVEFVTVPLYDGEIGIGRDHAPMIGRLGFGQLRYRTAGTSVRYYVDGGFVQVDNNRVSVLTNRALPTSEIDHETAREQLATALKRTTSNAEELAIRDRLILQARAQLRIANQVIPPGSYASSQGGPPGGMANV